MNFQRPETAILIDRLQRLLHEPTKLLERREVQLRQPEQLPQRNPEIARQFPGNHWGQSEEIRLRSVTARFSLPSQEQKTQALPFEELGKPVGIVKQLPNRAGRPVKNQKRKKKKIKAEPSGLQECGTKIQSTSP